MFYTYTSLYFIFPSYNFIINPYYILKGVSMIIEVIFDFIFD